MSTLYTFWDTLIPIELKAYTFLLGGLTKLSNEGLHTPLSLGMFPLILSSP